MFSFSQAILAGIFPSNIPAPLSDAAAKLLGLDRADRLYDQVRAKSDGHPLPQRLLEFLEVTYKATSADLSQIPRTGPTVIVANHPFGALEAAILVTAMRQIRPDVRVLTNQWFMMVPELRDVMIPVDVHRSSHGSIAGVRQAVTFLRDGGLLIVFPAGAVSHFHWRERASTDPAWNASVVRLIALAARAGHPPLTVPIFVPGSNGFGFHAAGVIHANLRTALLALEFLNKKQRAVELRVGKPITFERLARMESDEERIQYLRWRTYLLANRSAFKPKTLAFNRTEHLAFAPVIPPVSSRALSLEIDRLPGECLLDSAGGLRVYLASAPLVPYALREIGRLREIAFREAGEGTGRELDLDSFDEHYHHLFVWNTVKHEVVGSYRLRPAQSTEALYTHTLFHFDQRFLDTIGPAIELGRSFIRAEYQRGFAPLLLLWKGIGKFVASNPRYKTLFGPVSVSNQYQAVSRNLIVGFFEKRETIREWTGMVRPFHAPRPCNEEVRCHDIDELSDVISDIEPTRTGVPILLRQYLKLGGKLLGFSVDPKFANVLDGLIVVDLTKTEPKLLERYLGHAEAAAFRSFHGNEAQKNPPQNPGSVRNSCSRSNGVRPTS